MGQRGKPRPNVNSSAKPSLIVFAREQNKVLMKKLNEVEKAKDQAEQDVYNVGVAKTEEVFRSEVSRVCRVY